MLTVPTIHHARDGFALSEGGTQLPSRRGKPEQGASDFSRRAIIRTGIKPERRPADAHRPNALSSTPLRQS
jgi:hypothetical protein